VDVLTQRKGPQRAALLMLALMGLAACQTSETDSATTVNVSGIGAVKFRPSASIGGPLIGQTPRLFRGPCIADSGKELGGALAAALIPIAINSGLDLIGNALTRAGNPDTVAVYAGLPIDLPSTEKNDTAGKAGNGGTPTNPSNNDNTTAGAAPTASATTSTTTLTIPGTRASGASAQSNANTGPANTGTCLQFVYGKFAEDPGSSQTPLSWMPESISGKKPEDFRTALNTGGIYLAEPPSFFLEAKLIGGRKIYRLAPTILHYDATLEKGAKDTERTLFVEFGINEPGKLLSASGSSRGLLVIGKAVAGKTTTQFSAKDPRRPTMLWATNDLKDESVVANAEIRLLELRDGNPVLAALGEIITDNKTELATAIQTDLFPPEVNEATVIQTQISAFTTYQEALNSHATALSTTQTQIAEIEANATLTGAQRATALAQQNEIRRISLLRLQLAANGAGVSLPQGVQ